MTNLLHTGHLMPFKDQMCAGSDVAAYTRPRASEAALAAAAAAASSAELLSVSGLAEDSSYGAPAPADTTSELLLVEKVLALGLDCPPFAVLAFIPISFHTKGKALPVSFLGRRRRSDTPGDNPCRFLGSDSSSAGTHFREPDYKEPSAARSLPPFSDLLLADKILSH